MTKQIVNQTIKNIREGVQGFIEAMNLAFYGKTYKVYYIKNSRCRKMLDFSVSARNRIEAIQLARLKVKTITGGTGILINVFEEEVK